MDHFAVGNEHFVREDYTGAAKAYSKALAKLMGNEQFGALYGRARCRIETGNIKLAIDDLMQCISLLPKDGLSNYYLGYYLMKQRSFDYQTMKQCVKYLTIAKENRKDDTRIENALNRAKTKLAKLPKPEPKTTNETNGTSTTTTTTTTTTSADSNKNETSAAMDTNNNETQTETSVGSVEEKEKEKEKEKISKKKYRDTWYQSPTTVTYTLYIKNLTKNDVSIKFNNDIMEYSVTLPNNSGIYSNKLILFGNIIPDKCKYTVNKYKINCTLTKAKAGTEWKDLINPDSIVSSNKDKDNDKNKSGISAPWTTNKDWNSVDKFASEELDKDKPEGDEALQSLFQKIYADGSDAQKRAMVKSFQTSGGTVLSTNWDDVKNKDYEGKDKVLPTGQDVKKWEY